MCAPFVYQFSEFIAASITDTQNVLCSQSLNYNLTQLWIKFNCSCGINVVFLFIGTHVTVGLSHSPKQEDSQTDQVISSWIRLYHHIVIYHCILSCLTNFWWLTFLSSTPFTFTLVSPFETIFQASLGWRNPTRILYRLHFSFYSITGSECGIRSNAKRYYKSVALQLDTWETSIIFSPWHNKKQILSHM